MLNFRNRGTTEDVVLPNTIVGVNSSCRGTMMVSGTLRIDGEFEGDILNCDRIEVGEHGLLKADVEVNEAFIMGRVQGSIRALGTIEMRRGARVEGDVTAMSVTMEPGVHFTGRCTMLDASSAGIEMVGDPQRPR